MKTRLIKPSYLVSFKSSITGGISYMRNDIDRENEDKSEILKWETTRVIDDKDEYDEAVKVRSKAVNLIRRSCHPTSFGLICPLSEGEDFDTAVEEAKSIVAEFNLDATCSQISIYVLKGEIATSDAEAVRALSAEVYTLISEMESGIKNMNVTEIREVANKAKQLVGTLGDEQSKLLSDAIVQARTAARVIVKRVKVAGENASAVLTQIKRNDLVKARTAFLDYSEEAEPEDGALPAVQKQRFADIDVSESK